MPTKEVPIPAYYLLSHFAPCTGSDSTAYITAGDRDRVMYAVVIGMQITEKLKCKFLLSVTS